MELLSGKRGYLKQILVLIVLSYLFLMMGNSVLSLTNPDEVFYVQTAKEMMQQDSWMTPYLFGQPQFEKPILTYWLLRAAFELFGVSSFSARFFPALFGILGILGIYGLGLAIFKDWRRAMWAALVMMSSSLYIGLARTVFTDLFFTVFIFFSLALFYLAYLNNKMKMLFLLLAFVSSGLAVLTKGPLGFLVPGLAILMFLLIKKDIKFLFCKEALLGFVAFLLVSLPWYILMVNKYGSAFIQEFFYNDHIRRLLEAEHRSNDSWYFYPASILGCIMPWGLYAIGAFGLLISAVKKGISDTYLYLICWIAATFVIFQPAHSKLVSYIFPLFPAVALIVGGYISGALYDTNRPPRSFIFASWATTLLFMLIPCGLVFATIHFSEYIISKPPVYLLAGFFLVYCLILVLLLSKRRFSIHAVLISVILPALLYFAFIVHKDFDSYASSREACELLINKHKPEGKILVSKFFARGVRFFTDREVVVMDISGSGYFSPHPVLYLNTNEGVKTFLVSQPVTYAVLRKGTFKDLKRIASPDFDVELLNVCGDEHVVKVSRR